MPWPATPNNPHYSDRLSRHWIESGLLEVLVRGEGAAFARHPSHKRIGSDSFFV
jgi:hypothetical protein